MTFDAFRGDWSRQRAVVALLLLSGAALRLWQYSANGSLWLDEAALARNILERDPVGLLQPLAYGQVAPVGFLLAQKAVVTAAGASEYALRLVPLITGLAALPLFAALARWTLQDRAAVYAVGLFALGQPFIYFSSQVKQYSLDVTASLLALWLVLRLRAEVTSRTLILLGVIGALIPWFSQAAGLVLVGAGAGMAASMRPRSLGRGIAVLLLIWAASAGGAGLLALWTVPAETRDYLNWFWRLGYAPLSPWAHVQWLWGTLTRIFGSFGTEAFRTNGGLGYAWPQLFAVVTLVGLVQLGRARRGVLLILLGPVAAALAASMLRIYPLSGRLLVFLVPVLLLAAAAGAEALWNWTTARARLAGLAMAVLLIGVPFHAAVRSRPPYLIQPLRPVLERVEQLRQPGDTIYVDYAAGHAFLYYARRFAFDADDYVIGTCAVSDRRDYLRQVDRFRGRRRVWIVGTHLSAVERSLTVRYLEQIGRRIESVFVPPTGAPLRFAAYARLYDLGDPRRLASSRADTFTIREGPRPDGVDEWGCAGPLAPK
jgi:hypothetical protein